MTLTTNQLMTAGALAFAAFAVWQFTRKPGQAIANQPGQQQRDAGLMAWNTLYAQQWQEIERQTAQERFRDLERQA
jgi:hypothetical protein